MAQDRPRAAIGGPGVTVGSYRDVPNRSPWIAQLAPDGPARPLDADATTDVAIVGAGIAGVATAFFVLRSSTERVLLIERDRVARGATGRNAGQLTTYFERPLFDIAREFGDEMAIEGQRAFDDAHELLDLMAVETGATVRIERFAGHMGMFTLNHVTVHLRNALLRRRGGLRLEECSVSEEAPYLAAIPDEFTGLFSVVPQARIRELLETDDDRYTAVLSDRKGCANSGLLVQQALSYLERSYPERFRYVDRTRVDRVVVGADGAVVKALGRQVSADRVVLCTNGFVGHAVDDVAGRPVELHPDQRVAGKIGYMAAFIEDAPRPPAAMSYIRNAEIGGATPYVYVTRRTWDGARDAGESAARATDVPRATLTCMGGPEWMLETAWDPDAPYPGAMLDQMDEQVRPFANPSRAPGRPYDYHWHGLMGYMPGMIRVVGVHPRQRRLLYNLGCNGVGFLPSIAGAERIGRIVAGERLAPSVFDPRDP